MSEIYENESSEYAEAPEDENIIEYFKSAESVESGESGKYGEYVKSTESVGSAEFTQYVECECVTSAESGEFGEFGDYLQALETVGSAEEFIEHVKSAESGEYVEYGESYESIGLAPEEESEDLQELEQRFSKISSTSGSSKLSPSIKSVSSSRRSSSIDRRPSFLKGAKLGACLTPFYLRWSFGIQLSVRVLNLTTKGRPLVYYVASHAGVMYDYVAKEMRLLRGHKNLISSISADDTGKWLVSADEGSDNSVIMWDSFECTPVNTIFEPHPGCGTAVVGISGNAKYLVTIGKETKPVLKFWLWTYGNDQPDDSFTINSGYKAAIRIRFNPNVQEHVMVAFQKQVLFFQWDTVNNKLLPPVIPTLKNIKKFGLITDCTYIDSCHECIACTTEGYVLVFGSTTYTLPFEEADLKNHKIFVKAIKITSVFINCVESVDGIVATGDSRGHIKFYDKRMKILFWCQNFQLPPISSVSFNLEPRLYKFEDPLDFDDDNNDDGSCFLENCHCEDRSEEYESLYAQLVPSDMTLKRPPFIVRDFVISTTNGRVASIDYMHNKCNFFFRKADAPVIAIDTHSEEPYLVVAYANGNISLYNFRSRELLVEETLPEEIAEITDDVVPISSIKYSPESLHLACGRDNGSVWFLDPVVLTPKTQESLRYTKAKVKKLAFSLDSRYFAYYDENSSVVLMKYSSRDGEWECLGKLRSHYKQINDILFTPYLPSRFFSIGADRYLVEYDLEKSGGGRIEIINRERIEQCAVPISFIYYPPKENVTDKYFYMTDNQFKIKMVHDVTYMCRSVVLGPAYGCYRESPLRKLVILPQYHNHYMIFANNNQIGIQHLPADGNPYKFVGTIGHPKQLLDFRTCYQGKYVFTIGEGDTSVLMWQVNLYSVQAMTKIGGIELEPFYCLIEGGIHGWLFKEMQDLFYYMQILHQGENTILPRIVTDQIPVTELPDLMRACGFYPSEYEIESMIIDVRYRDFDETKTLNNEISFLDFVKLYINHRHPHGVSTELLKESFEDFCLTGEGSRANCISRETLVQTLCERGEIFTWDKAHTCLATLMHAIDDDDDELNKDFFFLPDEINFEAFMEDILGIDLERQPIDDTKPENVSDLENENIC